MTKDRSCKNCKYGEVYPYISHYRTPTYSAACGCSRYPSYETIRDGYGLSEEDALRDFKYCCGEYKEATNDKG